MRSTVIEMERKELAQTGVCLPEIGIGTWNYHAGPGPIRAGLDAGALFVDTAESYGSEEDVGTAIRGIRDRVFVATKVSPQNFRPADFMRAAEGSLLRLGIDAIDLLQLHEPNPEVPIADTMGAMERLIDAGKVRFAGVSNFSVTQLSEAQRACSRYPVVSNQVRYNITDRTIEPDLLPYCRENKITIIAYSPLARSLDRVADCDPQGVLKQIAHSIGRTVPQVILNWCVSKDGVIAVPKGNSTAHVLDNCGASGWRLTNEQIQLLDTHIQWRKRGPVEEFVKRHFPRPLLTFARNGIGRLPRNLRRKVR